MMEILSGTQLKKNTIDLTGMRFSKLVVLGLDHKEQTVYPNGKKRVFYYWRCQCDCGNEVIRSGNCLRNGDTKSCGCNRVSERALNKTNKKYNTKQNDLTGKVFSKLLVLGLDHKKLVIYKNGNKKMYYYWKCICECGNEVIRSSESLTRGATKSCGCYKFHMQEVTRNKKKYLLSKKQGTYVNESEELELEGE